MIFDLFKARKNNRQIVDRQYARLTEAARMPQFYLALDVPDTVMGRFEMLSLVMILYFRRTAKSATSGQEVAQEIIDAFFQDIDHSIRELGIGDQSVPKRMKKLAGMFYGRLEAYSKALELKNREGLAAALKRNIHPEQIDAADMDGLALWALQAETELAGMTEDAVVTGSVTLPPPREQG
ncbi:ubiquinol-cytochrome C chaperone family protein [Rhizobium sp.]|jgi:cytochrome b pre-mRNA-processing protein 3|uniref:ubiquinol-cytochrome C chaperone family protein n=1 Tax=Rhizobium sp. TaxID=391 RepID=UPI000E8152F0|nr:ubiquinol-cytochrome C chaperone [Rhizobium sp.]